MTRFATPFALLALFTLLGENAVAEQELSLARGRVAAAAPDEWEQVEPRSMILESEFRVPAPAETDADPARLTMMAAGGSIDQNLQRWVAQFRGNVGGADMSAADIKTKPIGDAEITTIDISGTYMDGPPRGPKTPKDNYRLLGAIVPLAEGRAYFFKLVGPKATVDAAAEGFDTLIESVELR